MSDLQTEFLFEIWVDIGDRYNVGDTPSGRRGVSNLAGGRVKGPKIKGDVMPSGADWSILRPDGATAVDVRLTIRTDDGEHIYMPYQGIISASPEIMARRARGEAVDISEVFVRTTPFFHTGSEKYGWLNRIMAVGIGRVIPKGDGRNQVNYRIYAVR